jgi:ribosome-associated protein
MSPIRVNRSIVIPDDEIELRFSPSGGRGGQHANKASTRAEITWNVDRSRALSERQRERVKHRLRNRIDSTGAIRVAADTQRSQSRNRSEAEARLAALVKDALRIRKPRVATGPTKASVERRLANKRRHSEKKRSRGVWRDE